MDEGIAKTLAERFELRATADGYQRAALQAVLRRHIHHEEQYYVGSWENNIVRLPPKPRPKPRPQPEAELEVRKRGYKWTNKFLRFDHRGLEGAEKSRALRELVRPLYGNATVPTDDIAVTLIRNQILKENIDPDPFTNEQEPASQIWGFPLPDEVKPLQLENYFGPEQTFSTKDGKRKATPGLGPRSQRPRLENSSPKDESKYGVVRLGEGKFMPPEIKNFWMSGDDKEERSKYKDGTENKIDDLPFFYLAETNYLAFIKSQHLKDVQDKLEDARIKNSSLFLSYIRSLLSHLYHSF